MMSFVLLLSLTSQVLARSWHQDSTIGICQHLFKISHQEATRYSQEDPLILWLGKPSMAIHIDGKYGPLPMPSVWISYVNVLYILSCSNTTSNNDYPSLLTEFMIQWLHSHPDYRNRDIYLAGDEEDSTGGKYLLNVAHLWINDPLFHLKGIVLGNPLYPPVISRHYGHRSFETVNNLTSWSINRARQNIICNSRYSQIDFIMNDIQLHFTPRHPESDSTSKTSTVEGMYEYQLSTISTYNQCYNSPDVWETQSLSSLSSLPYDTVYPTLTYSNSTTPVYPQCSPQLNFHQKFTFDLINQLLLKDITIIFYSSIYRSSQAICSFYIGIYPADGIEIQTNYQNLQDKEQQSHIQYHLDAFNMATLLPYESAWTLSSLQQSIPKAMIQDGKGSHDHQIHQGGLIWIQFNNQYAPIIGKNKEYESLLHKISAVDILSHLLQKSRNSEQSSSSSSSSYSRHSLDYTDLFT